MIRYKFLCAALTALLASVVSPGRTLVAAETTGRLAFTEAATPYHWDNVVIGGGGWMVSLVVHPKIPDLLWLGSDVSGPWKRAPGQDRWQAQAWNQWTPHNTSGVVGLALDPRDGRTVYVERGAPANDGSQGLYVTRDGLWRSLDAAQTWQRVLAPPELADGQKPDALDPGVRCVAIDPRRTIAGRSAIVYASLDGKNPPAKPLPDKPAERLLPDAVRGIYRSSDIAAEKLSDMTWQRLQKWEFGGILPNMMQGSRQNFGQIFMSGAEHGIIFGEPWK